MARTYRAARRTGDRINLYDDITTKIIAELEEGRLPWVQPWGTAAASFTARLTIDITPDLRGRIKIVAFQRGVTVADMLRALLEREFPPTDGAIS